MYSDFKFPEKKSASPTNKKQFIDIDDGSKKKKQDYVKTTFTTEKTYCLGFRFFHKESITKL